MTAVRNTKPVIDYSALTASEAVMPKSERGGILDGTPFVDWMKESRAQEKAKSVTVPSAAVSQTVYLVRQAAARIGSGVKIVADKPKGGNVKITFQARDKRKVASGPRKPSKAKKGESQADFRARVSAWETATGKTWEAPAKK